ncbi:MAG: hypothetical protein IPJ13_29315 [Saprospiraceae bacterium]|nr:hypothetical protein [Saprospiraceae bacterium]
MPLTALEVRLHITFICCLAVIINSIVPKRTYDNKKNNNIPTEKIEMYKKVIETVPTIEIKGATMPYTSLNEHMFSFLDKEGKLGLRLPKQERDEFIAKYKTKL